MKTLILMVALFLSTTATANERREYTQIDHDTYRVEVYNTLNGVEYLQQVGNVDKHGDRFVPCGLWIMYEPDGKTVQARAMFVKGQRAWFEKDLGDRVVIIEKKEKRVF